MIDEVENTSPAPKKRFDWLHITLIVIVAIVFTAGITYWLIRTYIFPTEFSPVTLNAKEQKVLDAKLDYLEGSHTGVNTKGKQAQLPSGTLEPEAYSEAGAKREVSFTEKELNSLLAKNTDLARKLAIDLSDNLVSAKLLVHVDPDFPILGGQILRVRAGVEAVFRQGRPVIVLKGVSVMGVPIPNAWLGGLKNIDLVREYGDQQGFWKSFANGVENIRVEEGRIVIQLKE